MDLLYLLILVSPAITGMACVGAISLHYKLQDTGHLCIYLGAAAWSGYMLCAMAIWGLDQAGLRVFTRSFESFLLLSTCLAIISFSLAVLKYRKSFVAPPARNKGSVASLVICLAIALLVLIAFYQHLWLPAFGWDPMDYWLVISKNFIENDTVDTVLKSPFVHERSQYRHPITVSLLAAFSGYYSSQTTSHVGLFLPWLIAWISLVLILFGFLLHISGNRLLSMSGAYIAASIPLLENHALIGGYAEIWLTASMLVAAIFVATGFIRSSPTHIAFGVIAALSIVWIKNTGAAYCACVLAALVFTYLKAALKSKIWLVLAGALALALAMYWLEVDFELGGLRVAILTEPSLTLVFAGYTMPLEVQDPGLVARNFLHAFIKNQSFSLMVPLLLVAVVLHARLSWVKQKDEQFSNSAALFLLSAFFLTFLMLFLAQLFLERGFIYAVPGRDTGNSRFSIPGVLLCLAYCGYIIGSSFRLKLNPGRTPNAPDDSRL